MLQGEVQYLKNHTFSIVQQIRRIKEYVDIKWSSHIPPQSGMAWLTQHTWQVMGKSQVDTPKHQTLQYQTKQP